MMQVGLGFAVVVAVALPAGVAWADPSGPGDVPQIIEGFTHIGFAPQATFLTTDSIVFAATYYDNKAACSGVAPTFAQLFVFNSEGVFILQTDAANSPSGQGPKYRFLLEGIGPRAAGSYKFTFLVRDCTNTTSVVLPEFVPFRVIAP
jgi:hypothetical protein